MNTLILNIDYTPLCVVDFRRGLRLALQEHKKLTVLKYYERTVKSECAEHLVPAVILCNKWVKRAKPCRPTKRNILKRDDMTCQYCTRKLTNETATIDHIKPVSSFRNRCDANTWTNMVASCKPCNSKKADKHLYDTELRLIREPKEMTSIVLRHSAPNEWREFL